MKTKNAPRNAPRLRNALWYSTSSPTPKQRGEAQKRGFRLVAVSDGRRLAARPSHDHYLLAAKLRALDLLVDEADATAIFGDFEPALMHGVWMARMANSPWRCMLFSSWKGPIQTWHEGSPTIHKAFLEIGML
jgi:hypothetical protein